MSAVEGVVETKLFPAEVVASARSVNLEIGDLVSDDRGLYEVTDIADDGVWGTWIAASLAEFTAAMRAGAGR